jgi:hypothetical protein
LTKIDGVAATALLAPFVNQLLTSIDFRTCRSEGGYSRPTLPMRGRQRLVGAKGTANDIRSRGTDAVVHAARGSGVSRVVVQSSYGVGPTRPHLQIAERLVFTLLLRPQILDTERQEQVVRSSGLEWTLVQPVYLTDAEDDTHVTSTDGRTRRARVSRRGVAAVHADLVESGAHRRDTVSVSG